MNENELLTMISNENSWEEIINHILYEEGMDPWDIDIVKLSDSFTSYLGKISTLDFSIPARLIIVSAVLLKLKSDVLIEEQLAKERQQREQGEFQIDLSKVPELQAPIKRVPTRKVTIEELVGALNKAFRTREKREVREYRARERVDEVMPDEDSFDISVKIDELYDRINNVVDELRDGSLRFSSLVTEWNRKEVVESLLPILHLDNDGKVSINQEEHFSEIYIKVRDDYVEEESTDRSGTVHSE